MSWFHRIIRNPHIDVALLVDSAGRLMATSNRIGSETQRIASMVKAAEILARGLSAELGRGEMRTLQLSTASSHLLVIPIGAAHYVIVLTAQDAPLQSVLVYMRRLVETVSERDLTDVLQESSVAPLDDIDTGELIEAVSEWLHNGGDSRRV